MILKQSISSRIPTLRSRAQEQPEPLQWLQNEEQQQQEGGSVGNADNNDPANNQQQTQNAPDPFADLDLDALPQEARDKITEARNQLKRISGEVQSARGMQSQFDKQKAEIEKLAAELQATKGQQQQQQQTNADPIEQMLREQYKAQGFDAATVEQLTKVNTPIMKAMRANIVQEVGSSFAPLANAVTANHALDAFREVQGRDQVGWTKIQEVQQQVWERTQQLQGRGELVDPGVVENLARIFYMQHIEKNGFPSTDANQQTQHQQTQPIFQPIPNMNQGNGNNGNNTPTYSFPGANGGFPMAPNRTGSAPVVDPDTRAALAATMQDWPVKPKAFRTGK